MRKSDPGLRFAPSGLRLINGRSPCIRNLSAACASCCSPASLSSPRRRRLAANVTPDRLVNADKEPQNWLMNHRTYDAQRFSPLDRINKANVKSLKLAYAVAIGGTSANENLQATPLAEDGFLYIVDQWGVLYKIDGRSGDMGRIVWRMDPGQEKLPLSNRGAALWGNLVVTTANYPPRVIATNKETGRVAWDTNLSDGQPDIQLTAAPLAVKDKIVLGAAGGDRGTRDFIVALDAATGKTVWRKYVIPAPGEPGSETWKDKNNAWQTGGGAMWVTGSYDVAGNQVIWGTGNPVPGYDATYRPGDNLYTNSVISWDADLGRMNWYFQYTPGDHWDYDEAGTHILVDGQVAGQSRKVITHSARNGFLYTMERNNGADAAGAALPRQHQLDERHRPEDRQAARLQSERRHPALFRRRHADARRSDQEDVPGPVRRQQFLARDLQREDAADLHPDRNAVRRPHPGPGRSPTRPATGRAAPTGRPSGSNRTSRSPIRSPARSRRPCTCPIRTTAARCRPPAAWCSPASPTEPSWPTTTPRWTAVEDQCRHRLQRPADDLRGQRQAIRRRSSPG